MPSILDQGPIEMQHPDWLFATDDELKEHANKLVAKFASILAEFDNYDERPAGEVVSSVITLPLHDEGNITTQTRYLGHCADRCRDAGLVIRDLGISQDATGASCIMFAVSTVKGMDRAKAEGDAEDNPERSIRTH